MLPMLSMLPMLAKPSKSWDIVLTPLGPSPPFQGWDASENQKYCITLFYVLSHSEHVIFWLGHLCEGSGSLPSQLR